MSRRLTRETTQKRSSILSQGISCGVCGPAGGAVPPFGASALPQTPPPEEPFASEDFGAEPFFSLLVSVPDGAEDAVFSCFDFFAIAMY